MLARNIPKNCNQPDASGRVSFNAGVPERSGIWRRNGMAGWAWKGMAVSLAAATLTVAGCGAEPATPQGAAHVKVVTSFYPMYYFASQVGGERAEVTSLVPAGVEPHDWEPKASDMRALNTARVLVYNGAGFEPWAERVLGSLENKNLIVVDSSHGLELLEAEEHEDHEEDDHADEAEEHGEFDPHVWLDPVHAQHQVQKIAAALIQADPDGKATYEANAKALTDKLRALDREYTGLSRCSRKEIVISHAFFAYPAKRYGLQQVAIIASLSPDAEPTPKQIAELVQFVKQHQIRYLFFETLISDKVAQVIAKETGARALVLNPIEGLTREQQEKGEDYLTLARANLANLKTALECR